MENLDAGGGDGSSSATDSTSTGSTSNTSTDSQTSDGTRRAIEQTPEPADTDFGTNTSDPVDSGGLDATQQEQLRQTRSDTGSRTRTAEPIDATVSSGPASRRVERSALEAQGDLNMEQGVETESGAVANQASEFEQDIINEYAGVDDPEDVTVRREGDRLVAGLTSAGTAGRRGYLTREYQEAGRRFDRSGPQDSTLSTSQEDRLIELSEGSQRLEHSGEQDANASPSQRRGQAEIGDALEGLGFEGTGDGLRAPEAPGAETLVEQEAEAEFEDALEGLGFESVGTENQRPPEAPGAETLVEQEAEAEHFGDVDWSLGLGDPDVDEVEQAIDALPKRAEGAVRPASEGLFGAIENSPFGESAGHAFLDAAGHEDAADVYQEGIKTFGEELLPQTAAGIAGLPALGLEVAELGLNPQNTEDLPAAGVSAIEQQIEYIQDEPATAGAGIVGGAAVGAGFGRWLGAETRLGTGRTGKVLRYTDPDPTRLYRGGKRIVGGARRRFGPDAPDADVEPVPTGRADVGTGGADSLFADELVDEAMGVSGPSRTGLFRGRVERLFGLDAPGEPTARSGTFTTRRSNGDPETDTPEVTRTSDLPLHEQIQEAGGVRRYLDLFDVESRAGAGLVPPRVTRQGSDVPDAPRAYDPDAGDTFEDVRQDALTQTQDDLRGQATRPDVGDFDPPQNPFGRDRGPTFDPETGEVSYPQGVPPAGATTQATGVGTGAAADVFGLGTAAGGGSAAGGLIGGALSRLDEAQQPTVTAAETDLTGVEEDLTVGTGIFGAEAQGLLESAQEPTVGTATETDERVTTFVDDYTTPFGDLAPGEDTAIGVDDREATATDTDFGPRTVTGTRTDPATTPLVTPDPDPDPTPDPDPDPFGIHPDPDPDPDPTPDPDPDPDPTPDPDPEPGPDGKRRRDEEEWWVEDEEQVAVTTPFVNPILDVWPPRSGSG